MMILYLDSDYLCHMEPAVGRTAVQTDAFNGKCKTYIEGFRFVPSGQSWTRSDGKVFHGEMIAPAVNYSVLVEAQRNYDDGIDSLDDTLADLMDTIEELCEEIIGE